MQYYKKLLGERIYLSPRNVEDVEKFTEWMNDFNTTDFLGRSYQIMTLDAERKYLEEQRNKEVAFSIVDLNADKIIGTVSLEEINHVKRKATLGIFIGDKDYRGNGYGTEAIQLILDFGFNYLNLNNIKLDVFAFNERAIACYKKCGFKEYGRRRQSEFVNGKYYDVVEMDILAEEFEESFIKNKNI